MKQWPDKGPVSFCDLVEPLAEILRKNVTIHKKYKQIPYEGYNIGRHDQACCPPPDEDLSPEGLAYHRERGRDLIDAVLGNVFRLGMEQGRRDYEERHEFDAKMLKYYKDYYDEHAPKPTPEDLKRVGEEINKLLGKK